MLVAPTTEILLKKVPPRRGCSIFSAGSKDSEALVRSVSSSESSAPRPKLRLSPYCSPKRVSKLGVKVQAPRVDESNAQAEFDRKIKNTVIELENFEFCFKTYSKRLKTSVTFSYSMGKQKLYRFRRISEVKFTTVNILVYQSLVLNYLTISCYPRTLSSKLGWLKELR